jgi:hypothetical protein
LSGHSLKSWATPGFGGKVDAMAGLTVAEFGQLARFNEKWRAILLGDDPLVIWELRKRGYLEILKRRIPLFKLSQDGRDALKAARL